MRALPTGHRDNCGYLGSIEVETMQIKTYKSNILRGKLLLPTFFFLLEWHSLHLTLAENNFLKSEIYLFIFVILFGPENVVIIPIMYLDWRWSQVNLIVVELLHRLLNLFTSSSVEHPRASENRLKYRSLSVIVRHRPARKLQNDVERYLSGVVFLRLVANSDQKRMRRRHFPVCVVSSEQ